MHQSTTSNFKQIRHGNPTRTDMTSPNVHPISHSNRWISHDESWVSPRAKNSSDSNQIDKYLSARSAKKKDKHKKSKETKTFKNSNTNSTRYNTLANASTRLKMIKKLQSRWEKNNREALALRMALWDETVQTWLYYGLVNFSVDDLDSLIALVENITELDKRAACRKFSKADNNQLSIIFEMINDIQQNPDKKELYLANLNKYRTIECKLRKIEAQEEAFAGNSLGKLISYHNHCRMIMDLMFTITDQSASISRDDLSNKNYRREIARKLDRIHGLPMSERITIFLKAKESLEHVKQQLLDLNNFVKQLELQAKQARQDAGN